MKENFYLNGRQVSDEIPITRFHTEAVGLFESLRTYGRKIFRKEEHLKRLEESARTIAYPFPLDLRKIDEDLELSLKAYYQETGDKNDVFIRLTLLEDQAYVLITRRTHPPEIYAQGVRLRTSPVKRNLSNAFFPEAKTSAYQNAVLASLEPNPDNIYEWVFLNREGYLTEVRIGNLFMVKANMLMTPPTPGILDGVTRRFVLECARNLEIPAHETWLTRHDLYNADEAFLTNTSWEILPVRELDGRPIGEKIPGKLTKKLHAYFKQIIQKEYF